MILSRACLIGCIAFCSVVFASSATANDGARSAVAGDMCPDANVLAGIIDQVCWSCLLPVKIAGLGDSPEGSASSNPFCACFDEDLGLPEVGMPIGFFQPARIVSFSATPYCMPSFGSRLSDDVTSLGNAGTADTQSVDDKSFFHYKYWTYPLMSMIQMFTNADCNNTSATTLDLMYFSEVDPLYNSDMLAFLMAPESIVFANAVAQSICTADCATLMAGGEIEQNFFCAGCAGNLYPLTGTSTTSDDDMVRNTELLTTRLLATLHRRGQAWLTMGNHMVSGSCEVQYAPTLPKTQYRSSMLFPVPEAQNTQVSFVDGANSSVGSVNEGNSVQVPNYQDNREVFDQKCCHKLGETTWKWGLNRTRPGNDAFVYLLYQWNDCCLR
ncbi:TraU family protein [Vibrio maritimus]|uniref:TraU family protein n=1 Tax=Vibrio maritimus TaxID=990268 RepID=UPI004068F205